MIVVVLQSIRTKTKTTFMLSSVGVARNTGKQTGIGAIAVAMSQCTVAEKCMSMTLAQSGWKVNGRLQG